MKIVKTGEGGNGAEGEGEGEGELQGQVNGEREGDLVENGEARGEEDGSGLETKGKGKEEEIVAHARWSFYLAGSKDGKEWVEKGGAMESEKLKYPEGVRGEFMNAFGSDMDKRRREIIGAQPYSKYALILLPYEFGTFPRILHFHLSRMSSQNLSPMKLQCTKIFTVQNKVP